MKIRWGILAGVGALAACSSDDMKASDASAADAAVHDGAATGGRASGGAGAVHTGGVESGGRASGGAGGTGGTGMAGKDAGATLEGGVTDASRDAESGVARETGPTTDTDAGTDASSDSGDAGNTVAFEIVFDGPAQQYVDTAAMEPVSFASPVMWKDDVCQPIALPFDPETDYSDKTWRIPAANCGVKFLFQVFPSFPYSYVTVTPGSGLSCTFAIDNGVGPYFDCTMSVKSKLTRFEIISDRSPLTNAGTDLQTFVH